jgi:hypothetical protein
VSTDPHSPTPAGPEPGLAAAAAQAEPAAAAPPPLPGPEPTPTVGASDASYSHPPGSAAPSADGGAGVADRPEVLAGAAFAGGLAAAMILKRLGR